MKNIIRYMAFLGLVACASGVDAETGSETSADTGPSDLRWMIGTWDCGGFSGYFRVKAWPGANLQTVVATYRVFESPTAPGILTGEYRESSTSDGSPLASFDESWVIDDLATPDKNGAVPATLGTSYSNGAQFVSSTGTVSGRGNNGILGISRFSGTVTFADGGQKAWRGNLFASTRNGAPDRLTANYLIEIAPGSAQGYHQLICDRR